MCLFALCGYVPRVATCRGCLFSAAVGQKAMDTQRTTVLLRLTSVICSSALALAAPQPLQASMTCRRYVSCVLPALALSFCTRVVGSNLSLEELWLSLVNGAEQIATDMWIGGIINGTLGPLWRALRWPTHSKRKYFNTLCYPRSQNVSQIRTGLGTRM